MAGNIFKNYIEEKVNFEIIKDDKNFGNFDSLSEAKTVESILEICKWNPSKINKGNNVFKLKNNYHIVFEENSLVYLLGSFDNLSQALKSKNKLINSFKARETNARNPQKVKLNKYRNIYKSPSNQKYYVAKSNKSKQHKFGYYESKEDAITARYILESNNWDIKQITDDIYQHEDVFYIITTYNAKLTILAKYNTKKEAETNKTKIISEFKTKIKNNPYKNIYKSYSYGKYYISKSIKSKQHIFGYYNSKEDALAARYILESNSWNLERITDGIQQYKDIYYVIVIHSAKLTILAKYNTKKEAETNKTKIISEFKVKNNDDLKYISKVTDTSKYRINKSIDGNFQNFGQYNSKEEAIVAKHILEEHDWNTEAIDGNIYEYNQEFYVLLIYNLKLQILGKFKTLDEAKENEERLILKQQEKNERYSKANENKTPNIWKRNGEFNVVKRVNGELKVFGSFSNYEDALKERDLLIANNWNINKNAESEKVDDMNDLIFSLNRWQKIVFDAIDNLDSDVFTFEDLNKFESNFRRFTKESKIASKVQGNLESLIDVGLVLKISPNKFKRLWKK